MAVRGQPFGFTLLELLIGMAIMLTLMAAVFSLVNPAGAAFQVQPEAQDLQQRLRVAMATLQEDLRTAGAGMNAGPLPGPLMRYVAPILPYRTGERGADAAAGVFHRPDAISVIYVPQTRAQAAIVRIAPNAAVSAQRPWGADNPRWQPFAWGRLSTLTPRAGGANDMYLVAWVGDDPAEIDGDPQRDGVPAANAGRGIVMVIAHAYGAGGLRRAIEATITRARPADTAVVSWREIR